MRIAGRNDTTRHAGATTLARLVAAAALGCSLLLAPVSARGLSTDFFTMDASQESILSQMAIHPSIVRSGSMLYLAWQGVGFDPNVASYDEATGVWTGPVAVGANPLWLDSHGAPALHVDDDGYLHVFYGCHWLPLLHAVSTAPGSVSSWRQLPAVSTNATYPQPIRLPNGQLLLFYRQGSDDLRAWSFRVSNDNGNTWEDGLFPVLAGQGTDAGSANFYAHFEPGSNGIVHCAFTHYDPETAPVLFGRANLYYVYRDTHGVWRNVEGDIVTLPVTSKSAEAECRVYESDGDVVNEIVVREEPGSTSPSEPDDPGRPLIQYLTGYGRGPDTYAWRFTRWDGDAWRSSTIAHTDHAFDSGTFEPHPDGSVDAWVVSGGSEGHESRLYEQEGRGGTLQQWTSADRGATWEHRRTVSPDETGTLFADPQLVSSPSATATLLFTEWTNDATDFFHRLYLWGPNGFVQHDTPQSSERLAGADRIATSIAISTETFPEGAPTVLLATSANYPDAMAAAPLGQALHGPVLLVPPGRGLPSSVVTEVRRLKARSAVVLGSTASVSGLAEDDLLTKTSVATVERIAGSSRYETALQVARRLGRALGPLHTAVVVDGDNYPDALSAGPFAAWRGFPVILAKGDAASGDTHAALADLDVTSTIVVGGPTSVSDAYLGTLPHPTRLAGHDRYETSAKVVRYALDRGLLPCRVILASGAKFPDALSGGVLGAHGRAALLLTEPGRLSTPAAGVLEELSGRTLRAYVLGGTSTVSGPVAAEAAAILGIP